MSNLDQWHFTVGSLLWYSSRVPHSCQYQRDLSHFRRSGILSTDMHARYVLSKASWNGRMINWFLHSFANRCHLSRTRREDVLLSDVYSCCFAWESTSPFQGVRRRSRFGIGLHENFIVISIIPKTGRCSIQGRYLASSLVSFEDPINVRIFGKMRMY